MCKREGCRHKQEEETSHIHMITTDATVLMKNNSDGEKTSENHKKTAKIQKKNWTKNEWSFDEPWSGFNNH